MRKFKTHCEKNGHLWSDKFLLQPAMGDIYEMCANCHIKRYKQAYLDKQAYQEAKKKAVRRNQYDTLPNAPKLFD